MPSISTNMHFGKLFIENSKIEIDVPSFVIGIASPETIDEDDFEDLHTLDEDGNIDVREFYEQFNFNELSLKQKSFILGYYCHVWFDEYYKFNASKLKIRNNVDLTDAELGKAVKSILKFYDNKEINNFFEKYKNEINSFELDLNLTEIEGISIKKSKEKIMEFFKDSIPDVVYSNLIDEHEYMNLIKNGCSKIMRSL
ncbi:hypothetical protein HZF24_18100 [Sedimentibacter hydroxybenzoicus DSM 7310]|uniref:Zinc dependent phospholipase C n=2 Tax=Sedimentibacter hydroxybenzoicus TaxID=29345 RepID=A0A974BMC9_SEDHY|nr:hypothetical protein [Sedimentibacter hydroxybenzoicus DSM 7310]